MEKQIIARGLLAGALGGVLAFVFARIFVQPVIDNAIAFEAGLAELAHDHGEPLFTRGIQANVGMGLGMLAFGVAMGALFAVIYCVAYGRVGNLAHASGRHPQPRLLAVLLAGGMFVALYLVPALKYPPNPPAVSLDGTVQQRTLLYLLMVVSSAVLLLAAVWLGRRLQPRLGGWNASLVGVGSYALAVAVVMLALPTIGETPGPLFDDAGTTIYPGFPADDLYDFRLYSLGTQLVLWVTIALVFAPLAARLLGERAAGAQAGREASFGPWGRERSD